jgi:transcriptional regulator with XRE-family HTH domain
MPTCLLSEAVRTIRESKGYSQNEVADALGITQQAYSKMERDIRSVKLDVIFKISDFLGLPIVICIHQEAHFLNDWYSKFAVEQSSEHYKGGGLKNPKDMFI